MVFTLVLALAPHFCSAQQVAVNSPVTMPGEPADAPITSSSSVSSVVAPVQPPPPGLSPWQSKLDRWVHVNDLSFSARYRSETATDGYHYIGNGQQRSIVDGRFNLDSAARYTINYHVSSGRTFNWAYSSVINPDFQEHQGAASLAAAPPAVVAKLIAVVTAGFPLNKIPSRGWEMYFRQLYASATPVDWLTMEYGSLGIERGQNSEITSYDDDGYITGERVRFRDPKHLFFDQIAVTYAYEGDIYQPNFFNRGERLGQSNYHQFLVSKNFGKRLSTSADYTFDKGSHTIREAVNVKLPETKILDGLRAEFYQRPNTTMIGIFPLSGGAGFGLTGEKTLYRTLRLDGGYEQVDYHYGVNVSDGVLAIFGISMNGDSYSTGKHLFTHANLRLTPYMSLSGFYIHQTATAPTGEFAFAKEGYNGGLNINLKTMLTKAKVM